jgi:hypothetical protein
VPARRSRGGNRLAPVARLAHVLAMDEALKQRAAEGDVEAMTTLGKQLMAGPSPQIYDALHLFNAAAHKTGGEAAAIVSVLAGAGAGTPQSWPNALDYLRRSAQLGWAPAQRQLLILAGRPQLQPQAGALGPQDWKDLRQGVDLEAWLAAPPARFLSQSPRIGVIEGFLQPEACDGLIEISADKRTRATVYRPEAEGPHVDEGRSNSVVDFTMLESNLLLVLTRAKIARASGVSVLALEPPSVLHYAVGQQFTPHFDFLEPGAPGFAADMARKGQRVGTFLVYLNEGFEGGETAFPMLGLKFRGRPGDALFFANLEPSGAPDRRTLHAGLPPTAGEKWLLSQWIRDRVQVAPGPAPSVPTQ